MKCFLILAIADPIASIVGEAIEDPITFRVWKDKKTLEGSIIFFTVSFFIIYIGSNFLFQASNFYHISFSILLRPLKQMKQYNMIHNALSHGNHLYNQTHLNFLDQKILVMNYQVFFKHLNILFGISERLKVILQNLDCLNHQT